MLCEQRLRIDYRAALPHHLTEFRDKSAHILDQISLSFSELGGLIFDVGDLKLVGLDELCKAFVED